MGYFDMKWRLSACRVQAGYSQKELADLIGVSDKTVNFWETGRTAPNMDKAQLLSEVFRIPLAYIDFTKEGNATPIKDRPVESGVTL